VPLNLRLGESVDAISCVVLLLLAVGTICSNKEILPKAPGRTPIEARLILLTETLHEGDEYKVDFEVENVSDRIVLVGRDLNGISNWPFHYQIRLEDASGHQYGPGGAGFVDAPPVADFSSQDGILQWWTPLAPHTFMGVHASGVLRGVPPGKYRLHGTYISVAAPTGKTTEDTTRSRIPFFEGKAETNSTWVEVLPREGSPK
jgi:hypothetical protein